MAVSRGTGRIRASVAGALALVVLAGCSNTPPPPVVSTPAAQPSAAPGKTPSQIVVGVGDVVGGYNPHNLADRSTVTTALSQLLLPSVFRKDDSGGYTLDNTLMRSAQVVSHDPFTVAYEIRPEASWSDGAPIAAEDFVYLADAMRDEPGVLQPAGYRLISNIDSREGGKRVEVTFAKPYPGWQTLFSDLLPAHLLKDAPGGWKNALQESFPAYGGPFSIKTLDKDRGEIILERNERYWAKPAAIERLVLRRADQPGMVAALRSGNDQFALARTDANGVKLFTELGLPNPPRTVARPEVASVLLRPVKSLKDDKVRAAITALIDRNKLIDEGADGGPSASLRADAQVRPPSAQGYAATLPSGSPPAGPNPAKAQELLTNAGYSRDAGAWRKDGKSLSVVLAAPGAQEPYASVAKELASQLIAAGIEVRTVNPPPRELFSGLLAPGSAGAQPGDVGVDIAVVPSYAGGDVASVLASNFGCAPRPQGVTGPAPAAAPANPAGYCDEDLQTSIDAALTGKTPVADVLSTLEPKLWQRDVVIPLFQLADTLAVAPGVVGVTAGPPLMGPFGAAVNWTRGPK